MVAGKIIGHIEDRMFVIEIPEVEYNQNYPHPKSLSIQHDFIQFGGSTSYYMKADKNGNYPIKTRGATNHLATTCSLQIGIRDFKDFYLPTILQHEYFKDEHFENRIHKGKEYPAYTYNACVVRYYDKNTKTQMVAFREKGATNWSRVSLDLFEKIKNTLDLYHLKKDE